MLVWLVQVKIIGAFARRVMTSGLRRNAAAFADSGSLGEARPAHGGGLLGGKRTRQKPSRPLLSHYSPTLCTVKCTAERSGRSIVPAGPCMRPERDLECKPVPGVVPPEGAGQC